MSLDFHMRAGKKCLHIASSVSVEGFQVMIPRVIRNSALVRVNKAIKLSLILLNLYRIPWPLN